MGKKKKFIDKKTAATFHIVQRRQDGNYDGETVTGSKYMLQPARYDTRLPADFPLDLLQVPAHAVTAREAMNREDKDDSEGDDEYDYEQHFRTIGETGPDTASAIFIANPSAPQLEILQKVVAAESKEEDAVERLFSQAIKPEKTGLLKISKDLAKALEGEEGFEELDDDFVLTAVREQKFDFKQGGKEGEEEEEDFEGDLFGEGDEGEEEEEEEATTKPKVSARNRALADQLDGLEFSDEDEGDEGDEGDGEEEEEEQEVAGRTKRLIDAQFDSLLAQYDDEEDIGELDPENPELQGAVDNLEEFEQEISEFASRQERDYGGEQAEALTEEEKKSVIEKLQLAEEDEPIAVTHAKIDALFAVTEKENWDCESIVSTYSNTENHPVMIKRPSKAKTIKLSGKTGIPIGYFPTRDKDKQPATVPEGEEEEEEEGGGEGKEDGKKAKKGGAAEAEEEEEDEGDEEEEANANLGAARNKKETKQEKQARKKEVKAARREARGRKKDLKLQYSAELNRQLQFDHHQKIHNPPVTKL